MLIKKHEVYAIFTLCFSLFFTVHMSILISWLLLITVANKLTQWKVWSRKCRIFSWHQWQGGVFFPDISDKGVYLCVYLIIQKHTNRQWSWCYCYYFINYLILAVLLTHINPGKFNTVNFQTQFEQGHTAKRCLGVLSSWRSAQLFETWSPRAKGL